MTARSTALPMGATRPSSVRRGRRGRHPNDDQCGGGNHEHEYEGPGKPPLEDRARYRRRATARRGRDTEGRRREWRFPRCCPERRAARTGAPERLATGPARQAPANRAVPRVGRRIGVCSECEAAIPPKRLLAVPDATTCVSCQERLEHIGL